VSAPSGPPLIVFRGLQGVAGALLIPASLAVITSTFSGTERGAAIGTWTAWTGVSTVIGPLLGGWLIGISSWRVIFYLNVPIALLTIAIALRLIPHREQRRAQLRVDFVGALLCVAGLGGLVFGFIEQPRRGWASPTIAGTLAVGTLSLVAFVVWEMHAPVPMLPLRLFRLRNFSVANAETLTVYGGLYAWSFFVTLFLQQVAGYSPFRSGLATLPVTIAFVSLSRFAGQWSMGVGPRFFMAAGPLIAGASTVALARLPAQLDYWTDLLPPLAGFAVGLALTVAPLTTTVLSEAGPGDAGVASGVNNAVARVAGLVTIAVIGLVVANGARGLSTHGFHRAMLITAVLVMAGGAIGAVGIRNP